MTTETDRLAAVELKLTTVESRLAAVEGKLDSLTEESRSRFTSIENRLNVHLQSNIAMWVTTMMAVMAVLATIILKL